jgi:hypothetical protein
MYTARPFISINFTYGLGSATTPTANQKQKITLKNLCKLPPGPPKLAVYLQRDPAFERRLLGQPVPSDPDNVARYLENWECQWRAWRQNNR